MLSKDSASREQNKISSLIFYAEAQPMLLTRKVRQ